MVLKLVALKLVAVAEQNESVCPPLRSHLTTFCSSPRSAAIWISLGRGSGELIAARGRSEPLAQRIRLAPPASVPALVRAALPWAPPAAAESRSANCSEWKPACNRGGRQRKISEIACIGAYDNVKSQLLA